MHPCISVSRLRRETKDQPAMSELGIRKSEGNSSVTLDQSDELLGRRTTFPAPALLAPGIVYSQQEVNAEIRRLAMHSCGLYAIVSSLQRVSDLVDLVQPYAIGGSVDLRFLCSEPAENESWLLEHVTFAGGQVRTASVLPACEVVIGGDTVLLLHYSGEGSVEGLALRSPPAVSLAVWSFQHGWQTGQSVVQTGDTSTHQLLSCLCSGFTDERAAREMKLSVRTYRRRVAELCQALEARSRFEAGVKACCRGLI
jgi:hypothetical protein